MKNLVRGWIAIVLLIFGTAMSTMKVKRVIFFGDSITEAAVKPGGYITRIADALAKKGLGDQYELIGAGIGGNKVYDLYLRMDDDVLAKNPEIVFIFIGVNDVWHKTSFGTGTDADKFERFYTAIIKKLQARNIRVILCTPAVIGEKTDYSNQQDGDMNRYSQIVRNLAAKYSCELVDLRQRFLAYNLKNNPENKESGILTLDRVHLNDQGNQLVADEMLEALLK
ncbi:MAG TPA: SGNH/GDSL hydrolase family protein [Puia sp.]|nr:SGNH/GDSL hydrolase family protein [Puia sp.]